MPGCARSENPLYLPEGTPLAARSTNASIRDALEVERFIANFAAEYSELRLAVLRLAHVIGVDVDSPLTRLLRQPVLPDLLGFDPLLQVIDADDAVAALVHAARHPISGPVNIAADGVVSFCQLAGRLGRPSPHAQRTGLRAAVERDSGRPTLRGRAAGTWLPTAGRGPALRR